MNAPLALSPDPKVARLADRVFLEHVYIRKLNLSGAAAEDYVRPMTATGSPQPVVRGPQLWPLDVSACGLVLGLEKQIEVHRQPQDGQFAEQVIHGPGGTPTSVAVPGFTVELDSLLEA